jgi:hypothetical protein
MKKIITLILVFTTTSLFSQVPNYVPTNGLVGWWPFTGNANDLSGNGNNGVVNVGINLTNDRNNNTNSAYLFTGNGNISLTSLPTTGNSNFSINGWIKTSNQNSRKGIICWGQDTPWSSTYFFVNLTGKLQFDFAFNSGPISNFIVNDNNWHNVCVTCNNGLVSLYVDGFQTGISVQMTPNINGNNKSIGSNIDNSGQNNFIGTLDDIGIWNRALTQQEITNLYNASLSTEDFAINKINIYPNPTTSFLNYKSSIQVEKILIYNMLGQLVQEEKVNALVGTINIEKLVQGTYLVKVNDIDKGYTIIKN